MRIIFIAFLSVWSTNLTAQAIVADPALGQITIANISNQNLTILPPSLPLQILYLLKVPIKNLSTTNAIPTGSVKIKVGLGSKLILNPGVILSTVNTSNYFNWSIADVDGQFELTGDGFGLIPVPPSYSDTATFIVKGLLVGSSTITGNFLVTNHNTPVALSDDNGSNNTSSQFYIITPQAGTPVPVTFTGLFLKKENCGIDVTFTTENEINLSHYEIEYSYDAAGFVKAGRLAANGIKKYSFTLKLPFGIVNSQTVFVRIKSVDNDSKFQYSEIKMLKDLCDEQVNIYLFPNPVSHNQSWLTVSNKSGLFPVGIYKISLLDFTGKLIRNSNQSLANVSQFQYNVTSLPAGNYLLNIEAPLNSKAPFVLRFQKL